jgi:hypothetical protein
VWWALTTITTVGHGDEHLAAQVRLLRAGLAERPDGIRTTGSG